MLLSALVGAVLLLIVLHLPEVGFIDDFSYRQTAVDFAQTGQWHYFEWSGVPLIAQAVWALPFIKMFGPTYLACRLSTVALMALSVGLVHALLRRAGMSRAYAALGALTFGLSPISLVLGSSFMTDVCALMLILVGLYCGARLLAAPTKRAALGWLLAGFACSLVGSTERQTVVLIGAVTLPVLVWTSRYRKFLLGPTALLWAVNIWGEIAVMRWFFHHPGGVNTTTMHGGLNWSAVSHLLHSVVLASLWAVGFLVPAFVPALARAGKLKPRQWAVAALVFAVSAGFAFVSSRHFAGSGLYPFLRGTSESLLNDGWIGRPVVGRALTLAMLLCTSVAAVAAMTAPAREGRGTDPRAELTPVQLAALLLPFLVVYAALIFFRSMWLWVFDRYMLLITLPAMFFVLLGLQRKFARVNAAAWVAVALYGLFGVVVIHDWAAQWNARVQAQARLTSAGVSDMDVLAGFELDAVKEFRVRGSVTSPAYNVIAYDIPVRNARVGCTFEQPATRDVKPVYVLMEHPVGCEQPSDFGSVEYRTWLPPFRREMVITKVNPAAQP